MLSRRALSTPPSETLAIAEAAARLRAQGRSVVDLCAGQPDFDTPEVARQAAKAALDSGKTRYVPIAGIPPLREAVARHFSRRHGREFKPSQILVTAGAKLALYLACQAVLNEGDEIVVIRPYWVSYPALAHLAGAEARYVDSRAEDGFRLPVEAIKAAVGPKTRAVMINSPSNPSGSVADASDLARLAAFLTSRRIYVISDEIYGMLLYEGSLRFAGEAGVDPDYLILVDGCSKSWAMTGWRLGFSCASEAVTGAMIRLQGQTVTCATSFAQWGAIPAVEGGATIVEPMLAEFRRRRDRITQSLNALPGVFMRPPEGAFYAFPAIRGLAGGLVRRGQRLTQSAEFCRALLEEKGLASVPGSAFGFEGHIRLSFAASQAEIDEAVHRLGEFLAECEHA